MNSRVQQRELWLQSIFGGAMASIEPASADASFRSYYRLRCAAAPRGDIPVQDSYILMDAPPEHEDCRPFMTVSRLLAGAGLNAPRILAADPGQGFLLLTDLGSEDYLQVLDADSAGTLYEDALSALVRMQTGIDAAPLPAYDAGALKREMQLFPDWFLRRHLGLEAAAQLRSVLQQAFEFLTRACLEQPRVFVHRDYHCRNLMHVPANNPGILDYQDAVNGPIGYDLVSLLRDVYIRWPEARIGHWIDRYHALACAGGLLAPEDRPRLQRWFDLCGVQRHLKVAGIFARLYYRDGKARYLADIPLTLEYLLEVAGRYPELSALAAALGELDMVSAHRRARAGLEASGA